MERFYSGPLQNIFRQYIYGQNPVEGPGLQNVDAAGIHPIHRKMGARQLMLIL
jgi:hypothetical protein